jgi:hypothetical protein
LYIRYTTSILSRAQYRRIEIPIAKILTGGNYLHFFHNNSTDALKIVYATIKNKLPVFREFVNAVRNAKALSLNYSFKLGLII